MIKFSIIIPFYNRRHSLEQCITSINPLSDNSTEVVFIDDASTDGSANLIEDILSKQCPRFNYNIITNQQNVGPNVSKNKGARIAQGEWLIFLDSDDELTEDFFSYLIIY